LTKYEETKDEEAKEPSLGMRKYKSKLDKEI
jgi:hypothetical protein